MSTYNDGGIGCSDSGGDGSAGSRGKEEWKTKKIDDDVDDEDEDEDEYENPLLKTPYRSESVSAGLWAPTPGILGLAWSHRVWFGAAVNSKLVRNRRFPAGPFRFSGPF